MIYRRGLVSIGLWFLVALAVWLDGALPHVSAPVTVAFWGWLASAIVSIFGFVASHAVTFAVMVAHVAVQVALAVGHAMVLVGGVFLRVYDVLGRFWQSVLRPTLAYVARGFERLVGWLNRTLRPVIDIVERIRAHVQRIYDTYVRPILDAIEVTRRVFQLLAALHVPWARAIDAKLAELEDRLLAPIRFVMQKVNEALNWINRIVTLDGLLQRVTLLYSVLRDVAAIERIWHNTKSRPLTDADRQAIAAGRRQIETREVIEELRSELSAGPGQGSPLVAELVNDLRIALERG